ncbi:MAG: Two component LuxR family transcriptional regulator [uncultured Aureispira sp.]|uniref:Two component LuxR family transcriptional regulator n=1 Tax=uncultured Aureispira sp. TaxID=1331704 RepID=A0A6S6TEY9_9BACT|nr:MAG: Two component LuxR family transcriptional regulator [uncultured Aureispira sp.]
MTTNNIINIAIVDDDQLVVQLLTGFLAKSTNPLFNVSFTANSGNNFLEKLRSNPSDNLDIILLDLKMQDGDGFFVLEKLQKLTYSAKVILLTSYYKPAYIGQMMNLGAHAFLPKEIDKEELSSIIQETYIKGHYFSQEQLELLRTQITPKTLKIPKLQIEPKDTITPRELEVLQLVAQQNTTKEISNKLFITPKTVEAHKSNLLSKTGVRNTAGLVMFAIQHRLIDPDDFLIWVNNRTL